MPADDEDHLGPQFVFHPSTHQEMGGVPVHTVEVWSHEHAESEWARTNPTERGQWAGSLVDPGTKPIASMSWHHKSGEIKGVFTDPEHQRQGIASSMWDEGHRLAAKVRGVTYPRHSPDRTTSGDAWARSVGGRLPIKKR